MISDCLMVTRYIIGLHTYNYILGSNVFDVLEFINVYSNAKMCQHKEENKVAIIHRDRGTNIDTTMSIFDNYSPRRPIKL